MKIFVVLLLIFINLTVFFAEEIWTIAMVSIFNHYLAVVFTTLFYSMFAFSSSWLCDRAGYDKKIADWLEKRRQKLSSRIEDALKMGVLLVTFQVAALISPSASSIILYCTGTRKPKIYVLNMLQSLFAAIIWCTIYNGGILAIKFIIH